VLGSLSARELEQVDRAVCRLLELFEAEAATVQEAAS
jgi:hypothetical protein